jgi:hypothetical protein
MTQHELPTPEDDLDRQILDTIAREGWMVLGIEASDEGPQYAFSVGLFRTLGYPEIVVMGLPPAVSQDLINEIGSRVRAGDRFGVGQRYEGIASNFPLAFIEMDRAYYRPYLGYARWFHRGSDFPAVQVVWPDKQGIFPWEPDYDADFFEIQRVLGPAGNWPHGWPFGEPPNQASFTVRSIGERREPVLYVVHESDGTWQFLTGGNVSLSDAMLVALESMLGIDPGLIELSDLPPGWVARRTAVGAPWVREPRTTADGDKNKG